MYQSTLSHTSENILTFLLNKLDKEHSILEIAKSINQDYKIVFTTIQTLKKANLIRIKKVSNVNQCSISLAKDNLAILAYLSERTSHAILPKKIISALQEAVREIHNPYYSLIVFGSYAKGTARPTSDVDLLVISPDKKEESSILAAINKAATLNNIKLSPTILSPKEFQEGLKEPSVAKEAYHNHLIIYGGEPFHALIPT